MYVLHAHSCHLDTLTSRTRIASQIAAPGRSKDLHQRRTRIASRIESRIEFVNQSEVGYNTTDQPRTLSRTKLINAVSSGSSSSTVTSLNVRRSARLEDGQSKSKRKRYNKDLGTDSCMS